MTFKIHTADRRFVSTKRFRFILRKTLQEGVEIIDFFAKFCYTVLEKEKVNKTEGFYNGDQ